MLPGFLRRSRWLLVRNPPSPRVPWKSWNPLILILLVVPAVTYLFCTFAWPQILRFRFRSGLSWYDLGWYGFGPSRGYVSFGYESPRVEIERWDPECDSRYVFIAPRGDSVPYAGPMILDSRGELVWMKHNYEITQDFQVQHYRGKDYLTYWEGEQVESRGWGSWYMVGSVRSIPSPGPLANLCSSTTPTPSGTRSPRSADSMAISTNSTSPTLAPRSARSTI